MQLIEQGFEFVVGDFVAGGRGRFRRLSSGRRSHGVRRKLAFAVQLVQQGLKLGVRNFVAARGGCRRLLRRGHRRRRPARRRLRFDCIERVQQQLEFVIGDVTAVCGHRFWRRRHGHGLRGGGCRCGLGQARQGSQQLRRRGGDRCALAHFTEHAVDRVQRFQDHVHQLRIDVSLTLAQDVEHVLGDVTALHQLVELEEAGAPFYSVKTAKNCIEQVGIIRSAFQLDQLFGQLL